jgi:AcrR family transcriptional regulator
MSQRQGVRNRLTAADWADAALAAMREGGGLAAIAIEPLAGRLGATKGSFYWHFANRDALVEAALDRWEEQRTREATALLAAETDPVSRLRSLFSGVRGRVIEDPTELALHAHADHPQVAAVLRRVTHHRVDLLADIFREIGLSAADARRRGLQAYAAYLGCGQLAHAVPEVLTDGEAEGRYADSLVAALARGD